MKHEIIVTIDNTDTSLAAWCYDIWWSALASTGMASSSDQTTVDVWPRVPDYAEQYRAATGAPALTSPQWDDWTEHGIVNAELILAALRAHLDSDEGALLAAQASSRRIYPAVRAVLVSLGIRVADGRP